MSAAHEFEHMDTPGGCVEEAVSEAESQSCPHCGYSLVGIGGDVCPECGKDPSVEPTRRRWMILLGPHGVALCLLSLELWHQLRYIYPRSYIYNSDRVFVLQLGVFTGAYAISMVLLFNRRRKLNRLSKLNLVVLAICSFAFALLGDVPFIQTAR
jgi:hypothetical protein